MPDDERTRRRLGDETKGRIADLASGWTVETDTDPEPAPEPARAPRRKQKTLPPPPPGSVERQQIEEAIVDAADTPVPRTRPPMAPPPARGKTGTSPPPLPPRTPTGAAPALGRAHRPSQVKSGPTETGTVDVSGLIGEKTQPPERIIPPPTIDASALGSGARAPIAATPAVAESGALRARTGAQATSPRPTPPGTPRPGGAERLPLPPERPAPAASRPPPARAPSAELLDDSALETMPDDGPLGLRLAVPVGEFDTGHIEVDEDDKRRIAYEQSTIKRDAASALLGLPELPKTVVKQPPIEMLLEETAAQVGRDDPTGADPQTHRFERGDPTLGPDATEIQSPGSKTSSAATLRTGAMLRRKRGLGGDLRYVATVWLGLRRSRRELVALEAKQATRQQSRRRHLVTLGRTAVIAEGFDHPALGPTREQLSGVEDERSRHTGQVVAADAELTRVTRDRDAKAKQYAADIAALDAELAEITKKLEPLDKQTAAAARRAADLRESLQRIDNKIAATEASMTAIKTAKQDRAAIQAEIVALRADRKEVLRDEPVIASELDSLNPRIAALEAARAEARSKRIELDREEQHDQRRAEELLAAIGAKRKVVDRAAGDAETLRDKILFDLGERLYVDRPADFAYELSPIDVIDMELGTGDRRLMELREILASVDRWKLVRGIFLLLVLLGAVGALVAWTLYLMS